MIWSTVSFQAAGSIGRHWKIAECSLSIGISVAPPSRTASTNSCPPTTSASLLASSRRFPARAERVGGGGVGHGGEARAPAHDLREQVIEAALAGEREHLEGVGMQRDDVERAGADRARRAEDADALAAVGCGHRHQRFITS